MHPQGIISQSGTRYIEIEEGGQPRLIPIQSISSNRRGRSEVLCLERTAGLLWQSDKKTKDAAKALNEFQPHTVIEHNGWTSPDIYRHPDGEMMLADASQPMKSLFPQATPQADVPGTLEAWKAEVAEPLTSNRIPILVVCLAFVPLLQLSASRPRNLGLQLVGPQNSGKSMLVQLARSVWGGSLGYAGLPDLLRFEQFASDPGRHLWEAFDCFLPIVDFSSFAITETPRLRARKIIPGLRSLSTGGAEGLIHEARCSYLLVGTESLQEMIGGDSAFAALTDLPVVRIQSDATHGVLSKLPDGHDNSLVLMQGLCAAAQRNPGHASKAFVRHIMTEGQSAIHAEIGRLVQLFYEKCKVDRSDRTVTVVAEQFGLIYAAGQIAKNAGVLPDEWNIGAAVKRCYTQYLQDIEPPKPLPPLRERLEALMEDSRIVKVPGAGLKPTASNKEKAEQALGFQKSDSEYRELWLERDRIEQSLPDWENLKRTDEARSLLKRDGDHLETKRKVFKRGKQKRFFVFRLEGDAPTLLDE